MAQPRLCNVCGQNVAIQSQLQDTRQGLVRRYFCVTCASMSIDDVVNFLDAAIHELKEIPTKLLRRRDPEELRQINERIDEIVEKIKSAPSPTTRILYERPFGRR